MLSAPIFNMYRKVLPQMSDTERDALGPAPYGGKASCFAAVPTGAACTPIRARACPTMSSASWDNQAEEACRMVNDWEVTQERFDLPADVWNYLKNQGFLGMIIPKSYGGLGFSAYAHSEIVTKLSTRSSALAVSVMVPNSLGRPSCCCTTAPTRRRTTICRAWRGRKCRPSR